MTIAEAQKVGVGEKIYYVDSFGDYWQVEVIPGNHIICVGIRDKHVGIEYLNQSPGGFQRTLENAKLTARTNGAAYESAMWGW